MSAVLPLTIDMVRGVLAREGPTAAAVREALAGVASPSEAWEILDARGMTPSASAPWLAWTPRTCEFCGGLGTYWRYVPRIDGGDVVMCASCKGLTVDAPEPVGVPDSIELAVALAGDPEGVARCSLLAVEALARLAQWGDRPVPAPRAVWRTASRLLAWNDGPENVPWTRGRRLFEHVASRVRVAAERALTSRERRERREAFAPLREVARALALHGRDPRSGPRLGAVPGRGRPVDRAVPFRGALARDARRPLRADARSAGRGARLRRLSRRRGRARSLAAHGARRHASFRVITTAADIARGAYVSLRSGGMAYHWSIAAWACSAVGSNDARARSKAGTRAGSRSAKAHPSPQG